MTKREFIIKQNSVIDRIEKQLIENKMDFALLTQIYDLIIADFAEDEECDLYEDDDFNRLFFEVTENHLDLYMEAIKKSDNYDDLVFLANEWQHGKYCTITNFIALLRIVLPNDTDAVEYVKTNIFK